MNPIDPTPAPIDEIPPESNSFLSKYPVHVASPKIDVPDIALFKQNSLAKVNHKFSKRAEEIREQISSLMLEFTENQMIWDSKMNFEPYIGLEISVYQKSDGSKFSSIISTEEWKGKFDCLGKFKLETDFSWKRISP